MEPSTLFITSFLTGLTTGGISCAAMQGGLLASLIANQKTTATEPSTNSASLGTQLVPIGMFLGAKLISHTLFGILLGALGSIISLSLEVRLAFQVFAATFMFATAMNLLGVHPIFRFVTLQPPKFLQRLIRKQTKDDSFFAPAFLGVMTLFIPCGVTQAIEVTAIASGSALSGGVIMFGFVLGTSPVFALLGLATTKLSDVLKAKFNTFTAALLLAMSLYSINGVLTVLDFPITFQKIAQNVEMAITPPSLYAKKYAAQKKEASVTQIENGVQKVKISITNRGYSPSYIQVKKDIPVELDLESNGVYSCASDFVFRKFNIAKSLGPTDRQTITFTPTEVGKFPYSCSMGMYEGVMEVL